MRLSLAPIFVAFFVFLLVFATRWAEASDPQCRGPEVMTIHRPAEAGFADHVYRFRYLRGTNIELPVVIRLPGGPGQSSIDESDERAFADYGFIQTDPRGAGCNAAFRYLDDHEVSTEILAEDVIAIIEHLNLTNYYLYGSSYGTVLGTVITHELEKRGLTLPKALILEGTVGRAFKPTDDFEGYMTEWENIRRKLRPKNLNFLKSSDEPLGYTSAQWGKFLGDLLLMGTPPDSPDRVLIDFYLGFHSSVFVSLLNGMLDNVSLQMSEGMRYVYRNVGCRELSPGWTSDLYLIDGELAEAPTYRNICEGIALDRPFDAKNFPIQKTPIIYFSGTNDPATPEELTRHHIQAQSQAARTWVSVKGGGHGSLHYNLSDCKDKIWRSFIFQNLTLEEALATCKLPTMRTTY